MNFYKELLVNAPHMEIPPPLIMTSEVSVNCYTPEGCLFCDKYRIHVDATDIRKSLSCRYCIEKQHILLEE